MMIGNFILYLSIAPAGVKISGRPEEFRSRFEALKEKRAAFNLGALSNFTAYPGIIACPPYKGSACWSLAGPPGVD